MQSTRIRVVSFFIFFSTLMSSFPGHATLVLENPTSQFPTILGVEDVEVGDLTFNVYFGRGTYNTLYLGVGTPLRLTADRGPFVFDISADLFDNDPYIFPDATQAVDAWNVVIAEAFDGTVFDDRPQLTNSCGIPSSCRVISPFGEIGDVLDGRVSVLQFNNFFDNNLDGLSTGTEDPDFRTENDSAYALWFLTADAGAPVTPAPVPLPSSVIAFLSGLFVFLNLSKSFTGRR